MIADERPRWHYRFNNYSRAFLLLREAIETFGAREVNQLEKEGIIQRFEYTWELAWKTLKDYLDYSGVILPTATPRTVIRAAFAANVIHDGEAWMKALDARNKMSHTYNFALFEQVIQDIEREYLALFDTLYTNFLEKSLDDDTP